MAAAALLAAGVLVLVAAVLVLDTWAEVCAGEDWAVVGELEVEAAADVDEAATPIVVKGAASTSKLVTLKLVEQSQSPPRQQKVFGEQYDIEFPPSSASTHYSQNPHVVLPEAMRLTLRSNTELWTFRAGPRLIRAGATEVFDSGIQIWIVLRRYIGHLTDSIVEACEALATADRDTIRLARCILYCAFTIGVPTAAILR